MKQKKYSHVRKSNYRPPKNHSPQKHPEKRMREEREYVRSVSRSRSAADRRTASRKHASSYGSVPERRDPRKHSSPSRLILRKKARKIKAGLLLLVICAIGCSAIFLVRSLGTGEAGDHKKSVQTAAKKNDAQDQPLDMQKTEEIAFAPRSTEATRPEKLIEYTELEVDGTLMENVDGYAADQEIDFGMGDKYTKADGIVTFRGNNFRDTAAFGTADIKENTLSKIWSKDTGSLSSGDTVWTGSGWTGQPLMQKWPKEIRSHMNMYDWAKEKENLVEVIYACMDGYVYFLDLETGKETRDALYLGYTFKGSGALDPRGYPILYVGAGYNSDEGTARVFVVNLLDCSTMYTFGDNDEFSLRGSLSFFDSSPLVDAETDTLIYPGENGILYLIKLNTQYDPEAGSLSISPGKTVKWHYYGTRSSEETFWVGMEDSAAIYKNYIFLADNGGNMMCLDLNTMKLVWVQDILDDSNSTPVLSVENGHLYLYVSTSFRLGWRSYDSATIPVWKLDAETGEIVWQTDYQCYTDDGVSGGVQSTIASGKNNLSDYIYVTVSKTEDNASGVLHCLDKKTGELVWEHKSGYAWSSPVCVYDKEEKGKVLYCSSDGNMYFLDGRTGQVYDTLSLSEGVIESSPAVYGNTAVVGTRDCKIWGVELQ